jgi:anti-sigma B factor antagonist
MIIQSERTGKTDMTLSLEGRLDTSTAALLERKLKQVGEDIIELTLDFQKLDYISSMGLRVLLQAHKAMKEQGRKLIIINMNEAIREVFKMTGFINLMVSEEKFVIIKKEEDGEITLFLDGRMDAFDVPDIAKELSKIKEACQTRNDVVHVFLNMEKLNSLSTKARDLLIEAIEESSWPKRELAIQNAPADIRDILQAGGIEDLFENLG